MSKSKGNVTGPDVVLEMFGADAARLAILFFGPADQTMEWTDDVADGLRRFLARVWRLVLAAAERPEWDGSATPLARKAHETIARVTDDIDRRFVFNTPISAIMELVNELSRTPEDPAARFAAQTVVTLIQPYAPHIAEELWSRLGGERLWLEPWPQADEAFLQRDTVELVLQVNGKVRDRIEVPLGLPEDELIARAKASEKVQAHLNGKEAKAFVVPDKLVNLVV
jgi:leucyl-tRNA synthetase